jgi:hypothetical protein
MCCAQVEHLVHFLEQLLGNIVDELTEESRRLVVLRDMEAVAVMDGKMQAGFRGTFEHGVPEGFLSKEERDVQERAEREQRELRELGERTLREAAELAERARRREAAAAAAAGDAVRLGEARAASDARRRARVDYERDLLAWQAGLEQPPAVSSFSRAHVYFLERITNEVYRAVRHWLYRWTARSLRYIW